jgi:hypothetical protein
VLHQLEISRHPWRSASLQVAIEAVSDTAAQVTMVTSFCCRARLDLTDGNVAAARMAPEHT